MQQWCINSIRNSSKALNVWLVVNINIFTFYAFALIHDIRGQYITFSFTAISEHPHAKKIRSIRNHFLNYILTQSKASFQGQYIETFTLLDELLLGNSKTKQNPLKILEAILEASIGAKGPVQLFHRIGGAR